MLAACKTVPLPQAFEQVPPNIRPLTAMERVTLTLDIGAADPLLELKVGYASEAAAGDAEKALQAAVAMAKQMLMQPKAEMV